MSDSPAFVPSQSALARALGCSRQLVQYHAKRPEAPASTPQGFDVRAWREFFLSLGRRVTGGPGGAAAGAATLPDISKLPRLPQGVAHALARLEGEEARAYAALQSALKSGEPWRVKACREAWLTVSNALRRYDAALSEQRRVAGELVERVAVERSVRALAGLLKLAVPDLVGRLAPDLVGLPSPAAVDAKVRTILWTAWLDSLAFLARAMPERSRPAGWIVDALKAGFGPGTIRDFDPQLEARVAFLSNLIGVEADAQRVGPAPPAS